jgi:hypothetical protein
MGKCIFLKRFRKFNRAQHQLHSLDVLWLKYWFFDNFVYIYHLLLCLIWFICYLTHRIHPAVLSVINFFFILIVIRLFLCRVFSQSNFSSTDRANLLEPCQILNQFLTNYLAILWGVVSFLHRWHQLRQYFFYSHQTVSLTTHSINPLVLYTLHYSFPFS